MPWLALVAIIAAGALFLRSQKGEAAEMTQAQEQNLDEIFDRIGAIRMVDPDVLRAIAFVESSINPQAVRWNPPGDVSAGIMQILCVPPAGTKKGEDFVCQNRFDFADQWPTTFSALTADVELNIDLAAQILAWNIRQYGWPRGLATYNNFAARFSGLNGPFPNDAYVNRVMARLATLKGIK